MGSFQNAKEILKNKLLVGIFTYSFFAWGLIMSFAGFWAKNYFEKMHHFTEQVSLNLSEIYWLSFFVFSLLVSFLAKSKQTIKVTIVILAAIGAISHLIITAVPSQNSNIY